MLFEFIGRRATAWLIIGVIAGLFLSGIELFLASFLQVFLKTLGLLAPEVEVVGFMPIESPTPVQLVAMLVIIGISRAVCQFLISQNSIVTSEIVAGRLRLLALYKMVLRPKQKFIPSSELNHLFSEIFPRASGFFNLGSIFLPNLIQLTGVFALMTYYAWRESLTAIVGLGLTGMFVILMSRKVRRIAEKVPLYQLSLMQGIERVARNWLLVKVLRTGRPEHTRLVNSALSYSQGYVRSNFLANISTVLPPLIGIFLMVVIIYLSMNVWHTPGIKLLAFIYLLVRFVQVLGSAADFAGKSFMMLPHLLKALKFYEGFKKEEIEQAISPLQLLTATGAPISETRVGELGARLSESHSRELLPPPKLEFQDVSFSYPGATDKVVNRFSLTVSPGEHFGISGESGSGKSTLLSLALGVLDPSEGKVSINSVDPAEYLSGLKARVGYVGPEPYLIKGSIRDNILYGCHVPLDDKEIIDALAAAELREVILGFPEGLDYQLEENGEGLSAGQKQRLALARAIATRPNVLVLDEASANLDEATEALIVESIKKLKGKCTALIVSHRPAMFRYADHVLKLG